MIRRVPSFAQSIVSGDVAAAVSLAVRDFAHRWEAGVPLGAEEFLAEHADLAGQRPFALEVAYEEYCQRTAAGEMVDAVAYCQRFPDLRGSLARLLAVHRYLQDHPDLLAPDEPAWPAPDQEFQGFKLVAELGRGTFARVYLAHEPALGDRQVALKLSFDGESEAETLGRLSHEHIVPVYSVRRDETSGLSAICMPFRGTVTLEEVLGRLFAGGRPPVSGRTIARACRDLDRCPRQVPAADRGLGRGSHVDAVVRLGGQLADALAHAHAAGICHRDLKPSNVLLDPAAGPLLLDFNLSSDPRAAERRVGGTLPYMPPEQIRATLLERRGPPAEPDPRSDLFALGVILYELLCCASPFGDVSAASANGSLAEAAEELIRRQEAGPRPIRSLNPAVDPRLAQLVESCLAADPERRPASAAKLAVRLRAANAPAVRVRRFAQAHRALAGAAAAIVLIAALAVGGWLASREPYIERQLSAGRAALSERDYEAAASAFSAAIDDDPDNWAGWSGRGYANLGLERWDKAIVDFNGAIHRAPDRAELHASRGYASFKAGQVQAAYASLREAVKLSHAPEIVNNFSVLHRLRQPTEFELAIALLTKAIEERPDLPILRYNRVVAEMVKTSMDGQPLTERSVSDILEVVKSNPNSAEYHRIAAVVFLESDRPDRLAQARVEMESAVACGFDPTKVRSLTILKPLREEPDFERWYTSLLKKANPEAPAEWRAFPEDLIAPLADARW